MMDDIQERLERIEEKLDRLMAHLGVKIITVTAPVEWDSNWDPSWESSTYKEKASS